MRMSIDNESSLALMEQSLGDQPLFSTVIPAPPGYRRATLELTRSPRLQVLRATVSCYEPYRDDPVRIEVCPLNRFAHTLRTRYKLDPKALVQAAKNAGMKATLLAEMQADLSPANEAIQRAEDLGLATPELVLEG